ncbi:hypothetical protein JS561_08565 [Salmonella enterica subsp. enterica serovar Infantis]|nr:hypothetical protein JS561_08565 [Salmonella enterica subsp. enterica serovar Infantis]
MLDGLSRWRGEHSWEDWALSISSGLSPLAREHSLRESFFRNVIGLSRWRGNTVCRRGYLIFDRFIPAGAGTRTDTPVKRWCTTVYPRWRREHTKRILLFINCFYQHHIPPT